MRFLVLTMATLPAFAFAQNPAPATPTPTDVTNHYTLEKLGEISHVDNFATVTRVYDKVKEIQCLSVSLTRKGGGADTETQCYHGKDAKVSINRIGHVMHSDNVVTHYKLLDSTNNKRCFGTLLTRTDGGAALSITCLE